jgi:hypothetical protein
MPMTFETDRSKDLTVFTITGSVTYEEFRRTLVSYAEAGTTNLEIYDLRESATGSFTSDQIRQLVEDAKGSVHSRSKGSKTALVVGKDIHYGTSRVYQAFAEMESLTWGVEVFRSLDEAYEWLGIPQEESGR